MEDEDLWTWAAREARSAPLWTDERWERANAILGNRVVEPASDRVEWSEAA
ncbi:hypothetical protein [Actinokineospora terrae]|uniref:hypothetical protein n=1 Tax=Actinokineospora terrae TaxID=155974 RepID=UPI0015A5EB24|nr:hypothetical protein [Actinokineospora terrae]